LVATSDPALVIFRFARRRDKTTVWLVNYSSRRKEAILNLSNSCASVRRTDFEGNPVAAPPAMLASGGRQVHVELRGWEMLALELSES
jgi:hypothetical protein